MRIITADASKVSPREFFDQVFGITPEDRQRRDERMRQACIRAIRSGDTYGWPPLMVADCRREAGE